MSAPNTRADNADHVRVVFVSAGSKLRVRIDTYYDHDGVARHNMYNDRLNCQFPRNLRAVGRAYLIPSQNVSLVGHGSSRPYYRVRVPNILRQIALDEDVGQTAAVHAPPATEYVTPECIACMDAVSNVLLAPCGHLCLCAPCWGSMIHAAGRKCPLCRAAVEHTLNSTGTAAITELV
jgi:hypothetical protein